MLEDPVLKHFERFTHDAELPVSQSFAFERGRFVEGTDGRGATRTGARAPSVVAAKGRGA
ncbi:MAG: hypothetical protein H0V51_12460 [Chloroflexi bacterium]|nr:hypothetical protein [Chloroflexota bacterium]